MSRQRSSTSSTSGRGSQSGGSSTRSSSNKTTTQDDELAGGTSGAQAGASFSNPDATGGSGEQSTKEKAQQLAGQVQQKATQRVESGLQRGKSQAAETLNTVAETLITTGQQLRERNQEPVSRYVDQAADRIRRVSNYLQDTDVSEIFDRTEEFARRRPALFLGGAFALGILGARFLKSSRRQAEGSGRFATGGGASGGQRRMREGITGVEVEVPASRQQEWAAGSAQPSGLADVARGSAGPQTDLLGGSSSGFARERGQLDFGAAPGGPEASQR